MTQCFTLKTVGKLLDRHNTASEHNGHVEKVKQKEAVVRRCSMKKVFSETSQNSQENTCEFCEISKNTFFYRTSLVAAFEQIRLIRLC